MSESAPRRLARAAGFGLALGLSLSAAALTGLAFLRIQVDCALRSAAECQLEQELARTDARLQGLGALGCFLVAMGVWLLVKRDQLRARALTEPGAAP